MRISTAAFLMILTTMFLSGCEQKGNVAAVEDRGMNFYARNGVLQAALPSRGTSSNYHSTVAVVTAPAQQQAPVMDVASSDLAAPQRAATQSSKPLTSTTASWQWPANGKVIQQFGPQKNGTTSQGITIAAAEGAPIHAAQGGEVAFVGSNVRDYGNMVILRHSNGTMTSYSHASHITVKKGDTVASGGTIGYVGSTGSAKSPQLHFAVREGDRAVDPLSKLPHSLASN